MCSASISCAAPTQSMPALLTQWRSVARRLRRVGGALVGVPVADVADERAGTSSPSSARAPLERLGVEVERGD